MLKVAVPLKGDRDRDMTKPIKDSAKPPQEPSWWRKYWFYTVLILLAVIGVPCAFFVPPLIPGLINDGNSIVSVRQGILAVLAGALTMLTLSETHRKNAQEKDKNERDHIRQVHAERRSRYTTAVGQLSSEKATIRLGGVYTLVGLIDEWLTDSVLSPEELQKEGQVIVNNLCAYIRSPYPLAIKTKELQADTEPDYYTGDFVMDQAALHEEQDVRRAIFDEMSKHSSTFTENKDGEVTVIPGTWSDFDFDFSRAPIFYPLSNLTIEKSNFSSAKFYGDANFFRTIFMQDAEFFGATFTQNADFLDTTFTQNAYFDGVNFAHDANFPFVTFSQEADFSQTTFTQDANFFFTNFNQKANFRNTSFIQTARFLNATFIQGADFYQATFKGSADFHKVTFNEKADFRGATFEQGAEFHDSFFKTQADFYKATFRENIADFRRTTFHGYVDFSKATFAQGASFESSVFFKHVSFWQAYFMNYRPAFAWRSSKARFSVYMDQQDSNFMVREDSQPIPMGTTALDGLHYCIPVGTVLFDPASWDEQQKEYTRLSEPAQ